MSTHPEFIDLMVEALYGESSPEDRERLEQHLEECEPCAEEFESLSSTLAVMAERERPELPASYWASYRQEVKRQRTARSASVTASVRRWWRTLPALLPQTGPQWAVQGALAVALLCVGLWLGPSLRSNGSVLPTEAPSASEVNDGLPGLSAVSAEAERGTPILKHVNDLTYNPETGTVAIQYETVNRVTVEGEPSDPTVRRLLQSALLDRANPSSQLNAMQTLERVSIAPSEDLVEPLTYLLRKSENPDMRLRALRALRSLHREATLDSASQSVLVGLLLDTGTPTALRVEALQTLTTGTSRIDPAVLYPVRNDSNAYLRYQARSRLQHAYSEGASTLQFP